MNIQTAKILLIDDDIALCELLTQFLSSEELKVDSVNSGNAAINLLMQPNTYDAIVLDIMMPDMSGLEVLKRIRQKSNMPIIMLTGRGDDTDRILGLEMGADDYLGKPCNPRELLARLRAVLRRSHMVVTENSSSINLHNITIDPNNFSIKVNNNEINATSAEFNTLYLLMTSAGLVLSKRTLTNKVLQRPLEMHDRSIDVHISRLRKKLSEHGVTDIIKSIRGQGYLLISE